MDRTWEANVGAQPPVTPSSFSVGFPQHGDVNLGTPATKPGLWWFFMITEELRNILLSAGVTPDASSTNQVAASIVQIANAAAVGAFSSLADLDPTAAAQLIAASAASTTALAQSASAVAAAAAATVTANAADAAAIAAQSDATSALAQLGIISSDNVLSSVEKPNVILDYNTITAEQGGIDAQAVAYSITTEKTAYDNSITALTSYLGTLTSPTAWNSITGSTTIVGTTFRTKWGDVYAARQVLLNKISAVALAAANTAQSAANTAVLNAATAQTTANAAVTAAATAQTTANTAITQLTAIASDNILSPSEKPAVLLDYNTILAEQSGIDNQATSYGITTQKTTYDAAITALTSYLGGLSGWNTIPGADVVIVGTTFRSNFQAVYTAKSALLNTIAAVAGTLATWANVTGSGKPANNASANITLFGRGNCVVVGNSGSKVGGAAAWDSDIYSRESYSGGAFASAQIAPPVGVPEMMFGLNVDPTADSSYASLDYAFYVQVAGALAIYESGSSRGNFSTWAQGDILLILYDGVNVRYYQNNTLLRTVAATITAPLFWDSSFANPGSQFINISLGPLSAVTGIGTGQIVPGTVTASANANIGSIPGTWPAGVANWQPYPTSGAPAASTVLTVNSNGSSGVIEVTVNLNLGVTIAFGGNINAIDVLLYLTYQDLTTGGAVSAGRSTLFSASKSVGIYWIETSISCQFPAGFFPAGHQIRFGLHLPQFRSYDSSINNVGPAASSALTGGAYVMASENKV